MQERFQRDDRNEFSEGAEREGDDVEGETTTMSSSFSRRASRAPSPLENNSSAARKSSSQQRRTRRAVAPQRGPAPCQPRRQEQQPAPAQRQRRSPRPSTAPVRSRRSRVSRPRFRWTRKAQPASRASASRAAALPAAVPVVRAAVRKARHRPRAKARIRRRPCSGGCRFGIIGSSQRSEPTDKKVALRSGAFLFLAPNQLNDLQRLPRSRNLRHKRCDATPFSARSPVKDRGLFSL